MGFPRRFLVAIDQHVDAPEGSNCNNYKYYSAAERKLAAEYPAYYVESEKPYTAPVKAADYQNRQSNFVQCNLPLSHIGFPKNKKIFTKGRFCAMLIREYKCKWFAFLESTVFNFYWFFYKIIAVLWE